MSISTNKKHKMNPSAKRIRKSRGQSKNGCFTCRARKVKCDERKPTCARCQRAKLQCEGYSSSAHGTSSSTGPGQATSSSEGIATGPNPERSVLREPEATEDSELATTESTVRARLVRVGRDLLLNSYGDEYTIGQSVLRELIFQFVISSHTVNTACAALGAATELQQNLQGELDKRILVFETYYGKAMALVKREIDGNRFIPNAIVAACTIFAAIELILRRRQDALTHLSGAYQALRSKLPVPHGNLSNRTTPGSESSSEVAHGLHDTADIDVDLLLRIFDFNTMSFTKFTRPPAMHCIPLRVLQSSVHSANTMRIMDRKIIELLHASVAYINTAARQFLEKTLTEEMEDRCVKYVELFQLWISQLTNRMEDVSLTSDRNHLLILRNLCMSIMIEIQAVFADQETEWDNYADMFQQIITTSEELLERRNHWKTTMRQLEVLGFTTQISMLQPIYLAALKYRNQGWRRRAIRCLRQTEREGPWIGEMMAAITHRIADIEEESAMSGPSASSLSPATSHNAPRQESERSGDDTIPENARISWIRVVEDNPPVDSCLWPTANSGVAMVKTFRRRRPVSTLSALVLFSGHFGRPETLTAHLRDRKLNPDVWEEGQERVEFGPERS